MSDRLTSDISPWSDSKDLDNSHFAFTPKLSFTFQPDPCNLLWKSRRDVRCVDPHSRSIIRPDQTADLMPTRSTLGADSSNSTDENGNRSGIDITGHRLSLVKRQGSVQQCSQTDTSGVETGTLRLNVPAQNVKRSRTLWLRR